VEVVVVEVMVEVVVVEVMVEAVEGVVVMAAVAKEKEAAVMEVVEEAIRLPPAILLTIFFQSHTSPIFLLLISLFLKIIRR
jgi:hypothetical protein